MSQCEFCAKDDGNYDFGRDCCLARFVLHVPTKTMRAGYLEWWMKKYGRERVDRVKTLVEQAWAEKLAEAKKQTLGHGK